MTERKHRRVFFECWTRAGYQGSWIYTRQGRKFGVSDVEELFARRPYQSQETRKPDHLYRESKRGLHIALFYEGFPGYDELKRPERPADDTPERHD